MSARPPLPRGRASPCAPGVRGARGEFGRLGGRVRRKFGSGAGGRPAELGEALLARIRHTAPPPSPLPARVPPAVGVCPPLHAIQAFKPSATPRTVLRPLHSSLHRHRTCHGRRGGADGRERGRPDRGRMGGGREASERAIHRRTACARGRARTGMDACGWCERMGAVGTWMDERARVPAPDGRPRLERR